MTKKLAHIHIGADGVAPILAETVMRDLANQNIAAGYHFVSDKEFRTVLRGAINSTDRIAARAAVTSLSASSDTLLFSRPKFMYAGQPLSFPGALEKAIYKFSFFQSIMHDFSIVIHLFLTDHVTYLAGHPDVLRTMHPTEVVPSWLPFVSGLKQKLSENSELIIWNVEYPDRVAVELYTNICGESFERIEPFSAPWGGIKKGFAERVVSNAGWDIELLDDLYEQDLKIILHGER